ncbi:DUF86 domain-containing protein [Methanospirillum lacunae]|uniref:DUF86 domain-containing protein n=2 Tax=Methanospirillum lacunae TaxID=668570 RepID=A0A2V2N1P2_9EURY|nr:DUF86 domain-containing protein [Methanospirillum lacunae]PWR71606.1 DUF86 domain-containing protein [Methanospirillum lacunae]
MDQGLPLKLCKARVFTKKNGSVCMDEDRRLRYQDKINWIHGRADLIDTWFKEINEISGPGCDTKTMLAIFKAFQEITEATMDCISMILRDTKVPARDDYSNIDQISLFSAEQKRLLREMNGLRNRIIHRYNGTDEVLALAGINQSLPEICLLVQVIEEWIHKV